MRVQVDPASAVGDGAPLNNTHSLSAFLCDGANRPPVFTTPPIAGLFVVGVLLGETEDTGVVALALEATQRSLQRLVRTDLDSDHSEGRLARSVEPARRPRLAPAIRVAYGCDALDRRKGATT